MTHLDEQRGMQTREQMLAGLSALPSSPVSELVDLEEALRLTEVGEYLYSERAYSYGDGQTEPREYGIEWQWQQSKPGEFGQDVLLADAARWHDERFEDGTPTEAAKLRTTITTLSTRNAELEREVKRLREAQQWQTIETAPHGVEILVGGFLDGVWKATVYEIRNVFWQEDWDEEPTHWQALSTSPLGGEHE